MLTGQTVGDAGREQSAGIGSSGSQSVLFGVGGSDSAVATSVECHADLYAKLGEGHGRKEQDGEDDCYEDDADDDWLTHGMQPPSLARLRQAGMPAPHRWHRGFMWLFLRRSCPSDGIFGSDPRSTVHLIVMRSPLARSAAALSSVQRPDQGPRARLPAARE